ncbi:reverse transcriptase domain-containing protein [Tanacetum coccineum]
MENLWKTSWKDTRQKSWTWKELRNAIFGFMHGITHPGLIKRLYERILRSMDEMYRMTTSFLQGEVVAFSHGRRKASSSWKQSEGGDKPNFKKGFKNKQRSYRKPDRFSLLTKMPKEIFALEKGKFKDWCEKLCIRQCFASMKHPQANGLVERANRSLGEGIKARLDERSKDWIEELPHVLWAYRTMIKSSNRETPFSLTYGTEAVIPAEIGMPTLRTAEIDQAKSNEEIRQCRWPFSNLPLISIANLLIMYL